MQMLLDVISFLAAGGVSGVVVVWFVKAILSERISQSIKNEYSESLEILKSELKSKSDFEGLILSGIIEKYWQLGEVATKISHDSTQLVSKIATIYDKGQSEEKVEVEILKEINEFLSIDSAKILEESMLLKKYYTLLPCEVVENLKEFETSIWMVLKEHQWHNSNLLTDSLDELIRSIRSVNAALLLGEKKISDLISTSPLNGFTPQYIKQAFTLKET